jgi:hypothetical protein
MKHFLLVIAVLIIASDFISAQENAFTLSGGYVFTNLEEVDENANGFRINGLYEFNPGMGKFSHGITVAYLRTGVTSTVASQTTDYTLSNLPIYYAPKFIFGNESFKGFLKGALGTHSSWYKRTGTLGEFDSQDWGFYGGASLGAMKSFSEKVFINLEYEWAYLSNSYYRDGFVNSIMGGIGFRF